MENYLLKHSQESYVTVGDGSLIKVYIHDVRVRIADKEFEVAVGFSRHLGIGFNVIGRLNIFERFTICFDESEKRIGFFLKSG
ncbi:MAG: hypothetical protein J7K81_06740 [Methanophagales archaeon]|nr:hypothetical protein [Methanophagales archaeon]